MLESFLYVHSIGTCSACAANDCFRPIQSERSFTDFILIVFSICPSISTFTMTLSMLVYCHNTKSHQHQIFHRPFFLYHVFSSAISCPWTRKFVLDSIWNKLIRSQSLSVYFHLSDLTRINWNNSWSWKVVQLSLHKMSLTKKVAAITKVNTCKSTFVNMYHYWHSQLEMKHRH